MDDASVAAAMNQRFTPGEMHPHSQAAWEAHAAGLCVVPLREDGTKAPTGSWEEFQRRRPTDTELQAWYRNGRHSLGLVCERVSRGLEVLDFDEGDIYSAFREAAVAVGLGEAVERI